MFSSVQFSSISFHAVLLLSEFSRDKNIWLNSDVAKHHLEVFTLMPQLHKPINSLDVNRSRVVCGCDNEAVYVFKNVVLWVVLSGFQVNTASYSVCLLDLWEPVRMAGVCSPSAAKLFTFPHWVLFWPFWNDLFYYLTPTKPITEVKYILQNFINMVYVCVRVVQILCCIVVYFRS